MDSQTFINALRQVEEHANLEAMERLFSDSATIWSPDQPRPLKGPAGVRQFWQQYRDTFAQVCSTICATVDGKDRAALEWESRGTIAGVNQPFCYRGVTVLEWTDGKINRLASYFDPTTLTVIQPGTGAPGPAKAQAQGRGRYPAYGEG